MAEAVVNRVLESVASNGAISDDEMRVLDFTLPEGMLDRALDLVDKAKVTRMMGRHSGAIIHTVKSQAARRKADDEATDRAYLCLPRFCTCHGFAGRSMHGVYLCKHLIAIQIAEAVGAVAVRPVSDSSLVAKQMRLLHPVMPADVPAASIPATGGFQASSSQLVETPLSQKHDAAAKGVWPLTSTQVPG